MDNINKTIDETTNIENEPCLLYTSNKHCYKENYIAVNKTGKCRLRIQNPSNNQTYTNDHGCYPQRDLLHYEHYNCKQEKQDGYSLSLIHI